MPRLIGRESELATIEGFLGAVQGGSGVCVLAGEAGIGKSSLWREGVALARADGFEVLEARPAEPEAALSFTALGDLFDGVLSRVATELPTPQRRALEVAVLRAGGMDESAEPRAIWVALLSVLRILATSRPVLCAIDDLQWLDRASGAAIEFAARRLREERVGLLLSLRSPGVDRVMPFGLDRALPPESLVELRVEPLTLPAMEQLLRTRLSRVLSRGTVRRVFEASGGNPFYALELGRAVERRGVEPTASEPLPVPGGMEDLAVERVAALDPSARELLLVAASLAQPTVVVVEEALGPTRAKSGLEAALQADVIELDRDRIRFTHPLLASASLAQALPSERRRVHARLSQVSVELEERARHLALASEGPDEVVAAILDEASRAAAARGAPSIAAEFAELASGLTPSEQEAEQMRRSLDAALYLLKAGDTEKAARELERVVEQLPAGEQRAMVLLALAWARTLESGNRAGAVELERALVDAGQNAALAARIHLYLASAMEFDLNGAGRHVEAALALLEELDAPDLLGTALVEQIVNRCWRGMEVDWQLAQQALDLERGNPKAWVHDRARMSLAVVLKHTDRLDEARDWFGQALGEARSEGDESTLPDLLAHLAELECFAGNWSLADRYASESAQVCVLTGQRAWQSIPLYVCALVDAHLGRIAASREAAAAGLRIADSMDDPWAEILLNAAAGFAELSADQLDAADAFLTRAHTLADEVGLVEPGAWRFHANEIEVTIGLGDFARARRLVEWLQAHGHRLERPWTVAAAARCKALLAAAMGEQREAEEAIESSLSAHESLPMPFELARTLLAAGQIHRRAKHKRVAKDYLERALELFEALPAPLWSERARGELTRIGLRPAAPNTLSATERQVADLAAAGESNRQIGAALFISPKTVEANLARVYRKLGVSSRVQLGAALAVIRTKSLDG